MSDAKGIKTEKLNIGYKKDLITDICLEVKPGEIVTLIGPNGSGKTTLLKTLSGQLKKRGGVVYLNGDDRDELKPSEVAKRMSLVMTYKVRPELMTCREVVEVGRYPYTGSLGILSEYDREKVRSAMEQTDVADLEDVLFTNISDGQRQRVLLARAICQEPEILILDEPTSFLDIRHKIDILQKIKLFAKDNNVAVLMSLHELGIAKNISDTLIAVGEGKVQKIGKPSEVFSESFIRKLYHLEGVDTAVLGKMPWDEVDQGDGVPGSLWGQRKEMDHEPRPLGPPALMVQGTMSNAGKSIIAAGLCRIFANDGYRVMPFKSQNMALNSYITEDGLEMGRAQVMQAECARVKPLAIMNPILLKPTDDVGSQVIVNGKVVGNMKAAEYFRRKKDFLKDIQSAYDQLSEKADIIVIEGAGSPVEMNLKKDDFVNMGLAKMLNVPVLLVGDIDRGGIFAQLLGTLDLLEEDERSLVKGLVVNKFRGDSALFKDGIDILEERGNTKVVGVVPYMQVKLDDEDSLSERFDEKKKKTFDIAVIRLKHISNFTDFDTFEQLSEVSVRYVTDVHELGDPDMIMIPGSKNTVADLEALKESGLAEKVVKKAGEGICIFGICGGFQMLGRKIEDPFETEGGGSCEGLSLLPVDTVLEKEKVQSLYAGKVTDCEGILDELKNVAVEGYEIHMGKTTPFEAVKEFTSAGTGYCKGNVYGTYVHGFFDKKEIMEKVVSAVSKMRGKAVSTEGATDYSEFKDSQYELLAGELRNSLDMDYIYRIMGLKHED
ncbi:MAG: cobyric acid synthase [Butyrivibrio sp.]|nr:cobyric acid synthase [Butyrivibrio sp.]